MTRRKPPTMGDVAQRAGVTTMTVSRALRPGSPVSKETRARIIEAANALGYVLDARAAALSSQRTGFVAVIVPSLNNSNFADTVRGLSEGLGGSGFQLLIGYTDYDVAEEERTVELMLRRRPEALVLTGGVHTERCRTLLRAAALPVVETWDLPEEPLGHVVGFSNATASQIMMRHLYGEGFRRVAFIGGDSSRDTRGLDRRRGYEEAVAALGIGPPRLIEAGPPPVSVRDGAASFKRLMANWPDTDAVLCVSDLSAFGAMSEALRLGLNVPGDVAFAGFGAFDIAEVCYPRMTTTDVGARAIGQEAARVVLGAMAKPAPKEAARVEVNIDLLVRESTMKLDK
ncbi:MAG: LacI family DNA-binding transcriptional regulator [Pseudomonadota bacterium]